MRKLLLAVATVGVFAFAGGAMAESNGVNCSLAGQEVLPGQLAKALGQNGVGNTVKANPAAIPG